MITKGYCAKSKLIDTAVALDVQVQVGNQKSFLFYFSLRKWKFPGSFNFAYQLYQKWI